jgi:hypothetical protein
MPPAFLVVASIVWMVQSLAVDGVDRGDALLEEDGVVTGAAHDVVFLSVLPVNTVFSSLLLVVWGSSLRRSPPRSMAADQATPAGHSTATATETNNKMVLRITFVEA